MDQPVQDEHSEEMKIEGDKSNLLNMRCRINVSFRSHIGRDVAEHTETSSRCRIC